MKKILFILTCVFPFFASGQIFNNPFLNIIPDTSLSPKRALEFGSSYDLGSNALNAGFYHALLFENYISDDAKGGVLPFLKPQNDLAVIANNDLFYSWRTKNHKNHIYLDVVSRVHVTSNFAPDLYKLAFWGNAQFAGKTANLSVTTLNDNIYETFEFGFYHIFTGSGGGSFVLGGGIGLIAGTSYANVQMPRGSLYTSQYGDTAILDLKMSAKFANVFVDPSALEGMGASLNIFGAWQFRNKDVLRFQVCDLGAILWNSGIKSLDIDGKVNYSGASISASNGQLSVGDYSVFFDSLAGKFTNVTKSGAFMETLPFQARLMYNKYFTSSFSMALAGEYINDVMAIPEVSLSANKTFFNKLSLRLGLSAYGYTPYALIAGLEWNISQRVSIMLGTRHFEQFINVPNSFGQGYYFSLKWRQFDKKSNTSGQIMTPS